MEGLYVILIFAILLFFHVPIAVSLGVSSLAYAIFLSNLAPTLIIQSFFSGVDSFPLMAVPFFILAGDIMMEGGISTRLIDFCTALLHRFHGVLGMVSVFASAIFAAISGSGPATVACIGGISVPEMLKRGYDKAFATSLVACAGTLGPVIPPSLSFIMYGIVAGLSITDLFVAGIVPGMLMAFSLMLLVYIEAGKHGWDPATPGRKELAKLAAEGKDISGMKVPSIWQSFKGAVWALMVPVIILGGIYSGIFTPTESAIIACDYGILVGIYVYKEIRWRDLSKIFGKTVLTSGTCMILVACATAFGRVLAIEKVPTTIAELILGISSNKIVVLLLINVFLFIVGMLMETLAAIIILAPLLLSVVIPLGVDPIHFGCIMVVNLVIGMATPPVGVNLFVASRIGGIPIERMFKWLVPMIVVLLIVLQLVTYIPQLSLFLPSLFS